MSRNRSAQQALCEAGKDAHTGVRTASMSVTFDIVPAGMPSENLTGA